MSVVPESQGSLSLDVSIHSTKDAAGRKPQSQRNAPLIVRDIRCLDA